MDMEDFLTGVGVAVGHEPVAAFVHSQLVCDFGYSGKNRAHDGGVVGIDVIEGGDMLLGYDENVLGRSGMNVPKGDTEIVFVNPLGGNLTVEDLAEETLSHDNHLLRSGVSRHLLVSQLVLAAVFIPVFLLSSCASVTQPKSNDLHAVVKRFHHNLRWKYNEDAATRVLPKYSADFRDKLEDLKKDLSITAWETRKVKIDTTSKKAEVKIYLKYFLMPSTVVKEIKLDELWELINGGWFVAEIKGGPFAFPPDEEKSTEDEPGKQKVEQEKGSGIRGPAKGGVKEITDDDPDG